MGMTRRGRPRSFSKQVALEAAHALFWKRGFEQTGVDDLVWAMGVSTSSLYSTFEDKEALFSPSLDLDSIRPWSLYDDGTDERQVCTGIVP